MTIIGAFDIPDGRIRFTLKEVADILAVSYSTVQRYLDAYLDSQGHEGLRYVQLVAGGQKFISRADLVEFVSRRPWETSPRLQPPFDSGLVEWEEK